MFWQKYVSFWLDSLLSRVMFFVIPIVVVMIPVLRIAPRIYRGLRLRPVNRLHRELGQLEREIESGTSDFDRPEQLDAIEQAIRGLHVGSLHEADVHRLRFHLTTLHGRSTTPPPLVTSPDRKPS